MDGKTVRKANKWYKLIKDCRATCRLPKTPYNLS